MPTTVPSPSTAITSPTANSPQCGSAGGPLEPRQARRLLLEIAGLAILGDLTLRAIPWGFNVFLWTVALAAGAWFTIRRVRGHPPLETLMWLCAAITFASFLAWRDASFLSLWNVAAVFAALSLVTLRQCGSGAVRVSAGSATGALFRTVRNLVGGAAAFAANDVPWPAIGGPRRTMTSHAIGVALAIPALLVFGGLLAAADPVFNSLVVNIFDTVALDLDVIVSHGFLIALLAWLSAGYIRGLVRVSGPRAPLPRIEGLLGTSAVIIPLSAVAFVFFVFVVIQVGYLFGGEAFVREATGLTYAEYARRGFFELVTAAALVLPLLLVARWALPTNELARRSYRAVAFVLLLLVDLVTISAIWRMRLYTVAFGLTQDRLYATAFMFWVGFLLAWFAATALRDRPGFAFGGVVSGFALVASLNMLNPDGLIVRANVARLDRGESIDISYINSLSDDAVPAIVGAWGSFDDAQRCELRGGVLDLGDRRNMGWRSWNLSRSRASRARLALTNTGGDVPECAEAADGGRVIE